jgi:hypothetical protein
MALWYRLLVLLVPISLGIGKHCEWCAIAVSVYSQLMKF